ncbi:SDR family NAD(P)-dependent oxidoreductase [Arthrobacter sp. Soc17.1.1.1]|uniref:SDR family NAD(P)-dependent oxidoreductase n=1 Tax=Arthrobacter sp. Soc17.1.1.1 TaxID=3121277 RepID=UPI002FE4BC23
MNARRVVLITGGSSGIGLALAEAFLRRGDTVAVCGRSQAALDRMSSAHPGILALRADVTDQAKRAAMLDAVTERYGRLDILVNNAGTFVERDFTVAAHATQNLDEEVHLNLSAPIHLTGETLSRWPRMEAIVFVTSGFALVSPARAPSYGAVKAGLHGFADGLRRQLAPRGTHVLEVLPPTTDTPMNAGTTGRMLPPSAVADATLDALDHRRPMALPGGSRMLPTLMRVAPTRVSRRVAAL